ncbi:GPI-anchor transamidase [Plasmodium brasilianum]|uniref:GPI-anchor transamidase n=2 Tax=Plasmodium (Plasmodium) TaxID=418103 RepID=A0A1A8WH56_PLAMA|nr:GPI-anchor transamidase [Plasmodium malariae]KAI4838411.1 GPI-anchor transamidase [Plasmodium brasilianum]SBS92297.1 GPI-anchor transamidase, putative (GPI8) [Plasmodium malariae]SCN12807.1 GPI-anchor transamidase [Plasmodium malariae]
MKLKLMLEWCTVVAIKIVIASFYFSGVDIKNMKGKYKEIENINKKENVIKEIFLNELKKLNYMNNNVIALSTSRHHFNYRHTCNLLIAYKYLKDIGDIIDTNILLMIPFDQACNCRNIIEGTIFKEYEIFPSENYDIHVRDNLYTNLNIDYKNDNVKDEQIRRVIRHRYDAFSPKKNRLQTNGNKQKNLFIYMTGHGGVNFLKIQEFNIMSSFEFKLYIQELLIKNLYKYIFVIIDTCQGYSFYDDILHFINKYTIKNVFLLSSSNRNENSYSLFSSKFLSVSTVDRFTYHFFNYLENIYRIYPDEPHKNAKSFSMFNILNYLKTQHLISQATINNSKFNSSTFLHDKNILFFNSNLLPINKDDMNKSTYNQNDKDRRDDSFNSRKTCLGYLTLCGHIKSQIYANMANLYEDRSYYSNNMGVYLKEESYFTDYCFTSIHVNVNYMLKVLVFLFFLFFFLLIFLFK